VTLLFLFCLSVSIYANTQGRPWFCYSGHGVEVTITVLGIHSPSTSSRRYLSQTFRIIIALFFFLYRSEHYQFSGIYALSRSCYSGSGQRQIFHTINLLPFATLSVAPTHHKTTRIILHRSMESLAASIVMAVPSIAPYGGTSHDGHWV
jgi:hypothetical protein